MKRRRISVNLSLVSSEPLISATQTRNYALGDPLADYLDMYYDSSKQNLYPNTTFLMDCGIEFEKNVIQSIKSRYFIAECPRNYSKENVDLTITFMKNGTNIIYSPSVFNEKNNTYGMPDLLIRADFINFLFKQEIIPKHLLKNPSPKLGLPYYYVVVDIKFSTLSLCANGKNILNCANFPAYKTQVCVYNEAIGNMQGYTPRFAYILGRRHNYVSGKVYHESSDIFDRLGEIDFEFFDRKYLTTMREAISWRRRLEKNGKKWEINKRTLGYVPELYPNMKRDNEKWNSVKKEIAKKIGEITSIWYCGNEERTKLLARGITTWKHKRFNSINLGIKGNRGKIIDNIVRVNKSEKLTHYPRSIKNIPYDWNDTNPADVLFVDFETISDCYNTGVGQVANTIIYLIGVAYWKDGTLTYKSFLCPSLSKYCEKNVVSNFSNFVKSFSNPILYYWVADENFWKKACKEHGIETNFAWRDLNRVLLENKLTIRGCFNYKLKSVVSALHSLNLIPISYENNENGVGSMIQAIKLYQSYNDPDFTPVLRYNEIDCKALYYILEWLKTIVEK